MVGDQKGVLMSNSIRWMARYRGRLGLDGGARPRAKKLAKKAAGRAKAHKAAGPSRFQAMLTGVVFSALGKPGKGLQKKG